jgi:hypothetical protein
MPFSRGTVEKLLADGGLSQPRVRARPQALGDVDLSRVAGRPIARTIRLLRS